LLLFIVHLLLLNDSINHKAIPSLCYNGLVMKNGAV